MHGNARFFCQHPVHGFKPGAFGEAWPERCLGKASIVPSPSPIPNLKGCVCLSDWFLNFGTPSSNICIPVREYVENWTGGLFR
mgnify:CR=1 FL=1